MYEKLEYNHAIPVSRCTRLVSYALLSLSPFIAMVQVDVCDVLTSLSAALCAGRHSFHLPKAIPRSTWQSICDPWINERNVYCERLENVGDGIAGALVTARIYEKFPSAGAGVMTVMKQAAVSNVVFALILELADPSISEARKRYDDLSVRARTSALLSWGTRICKEAYCEPARASIKALGDRFEALLGYLYVKVGYEAALQWTIGVFDPLLDVAYATVLARPPKLVRLPAPTGPRLERRSSTVSVSEYYAPSTSSSASQSLSSSPSRLFSSISASSSAPSPPSSPLPASSSSVQYARKRKQLSEEPEEPEYKLASAEYALSSSAEAKDNSQALLSRLQAPRRKRRRGSKKGTIAVSVDANVDIAEVEGELQQFSFTFSARSLSDSYLTPLSASSDAAAVGRFSVAPLDTIVTKRRPSRQ